MYKRRDVLKYGVTGAAAILAGPAAAQDDAETAAPTTTPAGKFDAQSVVDMARALADKAFRPPKTDLPEPFSNLTFETYSPIRARPEAIGWFGEHVGYAIEPLHRGYAFGAQMQIALVADGDAVAMKYDAAKFDFGAVKPPADNRDIGFSGFRVLRMRDGEPPLEVAVFQGASFFRALAKGQNYGVAARGLSIRTADPKGEEFPLFRAVWIEKPNLAQSVLVVHALLDSERLAGAYRFTLRAEDATIIDTEATLFTRAPVENLGIATMAGTYISGSLDKRRGDDVRPAVFDVAGLQMLNGRNEWLWRPISNRETLQLSAFVDEQPRGFGFMQRDRTFGRFLDDETHWERRPSLWIEPLNEWGPGEVTLVEIPSDSEVNRNIIAYWRPRAALAAKAEMSFAYRQFWCWTPPDRPPGAVTVFSRSGRVPGSPGNARRRRFLVEFAGDSLAEAARGGEISANLSSSSGAITAMKTYLGAEKKSFRVQFDAEIGGEPLSEFRLLLEASGKPVSETWLYRWTP